MPTEKVSPFTWLDALTQKKGDPLTEYGEKAYPAFMVNRGLSYFSDTLLHAAEINRYPNLDNKLQYDYYMNALRPGKRMTKWGKKGNHEDVNFVMQYYGFSRRKAEQALRALTPAQLETIKEKLEKGRDN